MTSEINIINEVIRRRRSIFPVSYTEEEVPAAVIEQILENANYAPTHKITEPWRFMVFRGAGKQRLGVEMARIYKEVTPQASFLQKKHDSIMQKAGQASCIIVLNVKLHTALLPEWEELAALSCAVQNMALTAEALKVGGYWSSPGIINDLRSFLELAEDEKCYGLFYLGYHDEKPREAKRSPMAQKVKWIED